MEIYHEEEKFSRLLLQVFFTQIFTKKFTFLSKIDTFFTQSFRIYTKIVTAVFHFCKKKISFKNIKEF